VPVDAPIPEKTLGDRHSRFIVSVDVTADPAP